MEAIELKFIRSRVSIDITTISKPLPLSSGGRGKEKKLLNAQTASEQQQQLILQYAFMFSPFRHKIPMYISSTSCRLIFSLPSPALVPLFYAEMWNVWMIIIIQ